MPYKMKKGATAMYGPKAMMEKGPMAMKPKGPSARGVMDSDTKDMPVVDIEKGKAKGKSLATAMKPKGPSAMYRGPKAMMNKKGSTAMMDKKGSTAMMDKKGSTAMMDKKGPMAKSKQRVEQDYARNAIRDYETGKKSEARYEKKKELEVAAGEGYFSRHNWHKKAFNGR
tara:strand:- start:868 stop:1377 length:510 start_codon:yes stop_codon:yes gene_type:complete